jgi:hypothetical protein
MFLNAQQRKKLRRAAVMVEEVVKELKASGYEDTISSRIAEHNEKVGPIQDTPLGDETEIYLATTRINSFFGLIAYKVGRLMEVVK